MSSPTTEPNPINPLGTPPEPDGAPEPNPVNPLGIPPEEPTPPPDDEPETQDRATGAAGRR
jgi:hypothetical protein